MVYVQEETFKRRITAASGKGKVRHDSVIKKSKKLPCSWEGNATQVIGSASHKQPLAYSYVPWVHLQNFKHSSLLIQKVNGKIEHSFSNELTKASHMNLPERTMFTSRSKILILRNSVNYFKLIQYYWDWCEQLKHNCKRFFLAILASGMVFYFIRGS